MEILLIEDNLILAKGLIYSLEQNGFKVVHKSNIEESKVFIESKKPNLIILDISLPDGDGMRFYEKEVKTLKIPTIFLTIKDDEETIVKGLTIGAEDYITKPFRTRELIARINKILLKNKNQIIEVKDIKFDVDKMTIYKNDKEVILTSLELRILSLLFFNINKVVKRSDIIDKIWEWTGNDVNDNTITVYLKRIREKLGTDIIITIKGIGYRIDEK